MKKLYVEMPTGALRESFIPKHIREYAEKYFDVTYNETEVHPEKAELNKILKDYDAVITGWGTKTLDEEALSGNDRLKLMLHTGGTVGNYVDDYTYEHGVKVLSGNIMYAESVAEGTVAYMMVGLRRIPTYVQMVREGGWPSQTAVSEGLLDRTVGIISLGTISRKVVEMLQCFRVKIKIYSSYKPEDEFMEKYNCEMASLDEIFETCDIISVHSALNDKTRGMIKKEHFEKIKDGALFMNTARGGVIDEEALIEELKKNRFNALLDVYYQEPLAEDSPLRTLPNVIPMPHMAGPTVDRREWITKALIDEAVKFFDGETESEFEITHEVSKRMTKM